MGIPREYSMSNLQAFSDCNSRENTPRGNLKLTSRKSGRLGLRELQLEAVGILFGKASAKFKLLEAPGISPF